MEKIKHTYSRFFLFGCFLFLLATLVGCSAQESSITPIPLPTNTPVPPRVTPTNTQMPPSATPNPRPFPDLHEWDLLIISDSTNWGVGQYYAKLIEADMNVKVILHDCWVGALPIGSFLKSLQTGRSWSSYASDPSCDKPLADLINEAEAMVLYGNPLVSKPPDGSWNVPENFFSCMLGGYEGESMLPGFETYKDKMLTSCAIETFATYKTQWGGVFDEIDKIRQGRPLILRLTSGYLLEQSRWIKSSVDEVCITCQGRLLAALRQVAKENGVPVADTMAGLNGQDYMSEIPAEYIGGDRVHLSDAGAQFVATLLQQTGYAYAGK